MNGVHDMGGQQGFGPVLTEKLNPCFTQTGKVGPWP